jgi:hypothetical protein
MSSYLDTYGAGEERRNRMVVRAVLVLAGAVVLAVAGYLLLRNRMAESKLKDFRTALETKDYPRAYRVWGCTPEKPCPHYSYEKFLEDWGEKSGHTNFATMTEVRKVTCKDGYGVGWKFGDDTVHLWVVREDQSMSYDPWPNWRQTWLAALFNDCSGLSKSIRVKP